MTRRQRIGAASSPLITLPASGQHLNLQPVADLEKTQRFGVQRGTQRVFPEQSRIRRVRLQRAKLGGESVERRTVAKHALADEGVTVALGRGRYIEIVVFRMVLHPP